MAGEIYRFVGVDPGDNGAMAVLTWPDCGKPDVKLVDSPGWEYPQAIWAHCREIGLSGVVAAIEIPSPYYRSERGKQSIRKGFEKLAINFGQWEAALWAAGCVDVVRVKPEEWRKSQVGLGKLGRAFARSTLDARPNRVRETKKISLHQARLLFPQAELHLEKHDGRADATLIADWIHRQWKFLKQIRNKGKSDA